MPVGMSQLIHPRSRHCWSMRVVSVRLVMVSLIPSMQSSWWMVFERSHRLYPRIVSSPAVSHCPSESHSCSHRTVAASPHRALVAVAASMQSVASNSISSWYRWWADSSSIASFDGLKRDTEGRDEDIHREVRGDQWVTPTVTTQIDSTHPTTACAWYGCLTYWWCWCRFL